MNNKNKEKILKAFRLGQSTVVTIPKETEIKPGQLLKFEKQGRKLIFVPKRETPEKIVEKLAGGIKAGLDPQKIKKILKKRDEKMLS